MIRLLNTKTIGGQVYPAGSIVRLNPAIEAQLVASADADRLGALPELIAQWFSPTTRTSNNSTDTAYAILASVVLRGGTMGLNSKIVIIADWDVLTTGNTKTAAIDFGGSNISAIGLSGTITSLKALAEVQNMNSWLSQKTFNGSSYQVQAVDRIATSVDTSADVTIDFKCKWSANNAGVETITLLGYSIWHYPGV